MTVGVTLLVVGVTTTVGAFCAAQWGPPDPDLTGLFWAGGVLVLASVIAPVVPDSLRAMSKRTRRARFVVLGVAIVGAMFASSRVGVPDHLPGIALGWPLLFHIERGAAIAAAVGLVTLVVWRGANNEWPDSFGNLFTYPAKKVLGVTLDTIEKQSNRIADLEKVLGERISALESDPQRRGRRGP